MTDDNAPLGDVAARGIAAARIVIGVAATTAPRAVSRLQFGTTEGATPVVARMLGGRDLALGLGALLAARRGPASLRGWVEAGAVVDAIDALAFVRAERGQTRLRWLVIAAASGAAVVGAWAARTLDEQR